MQLKLKKTAILFFYAFLLAVMVSWQDDENTPNTMLRLSFLGLSILPAFIYRSYKYLPIIITLFFTVNYFGTALSYYPTYTYYYMGIMFIAFLMASNHNTHGVACHLAIPKSLCILVPLCFVVDLLTNFELRDTMHSCLFLLLCCCLIPMKNDEKTILLFKYAFIISTLVLCVEFITMGHKFMTNYGVGNLERERWTDPNYFGCVLGMGTLFSSIELLSARKKHIIEVGVLVTTIALSIMVLIMNASRGALLATATGVAYYVIVSKSSPWVKIVTVFAGFAFVGYLYSHGSYFELLETRMEINLDTGSGRTIIWERKLHAFFGDSNPFQILFGYGGEKGLRLAFGYIRGFHNEFLAMLVEYGFVGFISFISLVFYPLNKSMFDREVFSAVLYFVIVCFTLAPMTSGYITYYCFFLLIIMIASNKSLRVRA